MFERKLEEGCQFVLLSIIIYWRTVRDCWYKRSEWVLRHITVYYPSFRVFSSEQNSWKLSTSFDNILITLQSYLTFNFFSPFPVNINKNNNKKSYQHKQRCVTHYILIIYGISPTSSLTHFHSFLQLPQGQDVQGFLKTFLLQVLKKVVSIGRRPHQQVAVSGEEPAEDLEVDKAYYYYRRKFIVIVFS